MIEEVQDRVISILGTYINTELTALASPVGGVALALPKPSRYMLAFDPKSTVLAAGDYPFCAVLPSKTELSDQLSRGIQVSNEHELAIVFLLIDQNIEYLNRLKSRYAKSAVIVLKKHQQTDPLRRVRINKIVYDRNLRDERNSSYLGSVWILVTCWEREVL